MIGMESIKKIKNLLVAPFEVLKSSFVEFCDKSNIHGVRYFTERQLHWSERLWWLISIALSLWMCGALTRNIWDDWNEMPVTLSFTVSKEPVAAIPFPQVTFCPEIKTMKRVFDLNATLKSISNLSDTKIQQLNALAHICPQMRDHLDRKDNFTNESIYTLIRDMALVLDDVIMGCMISLYFQIYVQEIPILTEDGLCFTLNSINSTDLYTDEMAPGMKIVNLDRRLFRNYDRNWSFETPFIYDGDRRRHPFYLNLHGEDSGLLCSNLRKEENIQSKCKGLEQGFKMALNTPGESVSMSRNFIRIQPAEDTHIIIKPKLTYTSEELRSYSPIQRQCYFNSERKLRFFRIYSQPSCEDECLANFTKNECDCVQFSMPRDINTRICGAAKIVCYESAKLKFFNESFKSFRDQCNCLPSCTTIDYKTEINRGNKNHKTRLNGKRTQMGEFRIYYDDQYIETVKRIPVYTYADFLAICGGLLGLFMGASVLSIIEFAFFCTIRLYWLHRPFKPLEILTSFKRRLNELRIFRGIQKVFSEIFENSSIHGFSYFTRWTLHWSERLWWMISIGISLWLCYSFVHNFWQQWNENMVTLSFSKNAYPISTVPLPSITICSDIKSMVYALNGTTIVYINGFLEKPGVLEHHAIGHTSGMSGYTQFGEIHQFPGTESAGIYDAMQRVAPKLNDTMSNCWWRNELVDCSKYFVPVLTSEGVCFSFNAINSHEICTDEMNQAMQIVNNRPNISNWNFQNGYTNEPSEYDYPMRSLDSSEGDSLKMSIGFFRHEIDGMYSSKDFKIIFTTPGDALDFSRNSYRVPLSRDVRVTVNSKLTKTSEGLRSYTPTQRQCYFDSERKLRFFKIYTQANCEQECLAEYMLKSFGCVKFSLPRENSTAICGLGKKRLVISAELEFSMDERVLNALNEETFRGTCNCLPTCTTIDFSLDVDASEYRSKIILTKRRVQKSNITILFGIQPVERVDRMETYTFSDFLAICGGLLGLFMGISALSIIELIYLCTLRWFWKLRRERSNNIIESPQTRVINVIPCRSSDQ